MSEIKPALVSENSLMNQNTGTTGYDFDTNADRGMIRSLHIQDASITNAKIGTAAITSANIADLAVTSAKINDFSFNQGTGGTLTLGGTANGNGVMQVLNSSGGTVVTVNNSGVSVTNGNISIQDSSGTTILDATGLVSTANFAADSVTAGTSTNTTSTSYVDIGSSSISFTLSRQSRVLVIYSVKLGNSAAGSNGDNTIVCLNVDGSDDQGPTITGTGTPWSGGLILTTSAVSTIQTLAAGSHTLKLRVKSTDSGATAYTQQATITYLVLGK
jgi:hypothetical protein